MPIEEITLSVPRGLADSRQESTRAKPKAGTDIKTSSETNKLVAAYVRSARARDRFAFTNSGRMRNRERFSQSLKAIVKKIATDASSRVEDRSIRMQVRTQIYVDLMHLARAMSQDQLNMIRWARTHRRLGLLAAIMAALCILAALITNEVITLPGTA